MKSKLDVDFDYSSANFNEFDKHLLNQMVKNEVLNIPNTIKALKQK